MVEEYLQEENPSSTSSPSLSFPGLQRIMGFSQNNFKKKKKTERERWFYWEL
jgi:hypothetical protein